MINRFCKTLFLAGVLFIFSYSFSFASKSNGIDVNLEVGSCNNNGICEAGSEDMMSCPLDCVPSPEEEEENKTGSITGNYFNNLTISASYTSVIIKWQSTVPTMSNLKWGTSPDYKDGVIKNINYLTEHRVEINNLKDGTIYFFSIDSANYYGISKSLDNQVFQTLSLPDTTPPGNPTNVKILSGPYGITISWQNPTDMDFDYVRIMRTEDRYYASPLLGHLVYEGKGTYFTDANVKEGKKYFYVLFARDKAGNYSSGALTSIIHNPKGKDNIEETIPPYENISFVSNSFIVTQGSSSYDFSPGNTFSLSGDDIITVKTNYFSKIKNDDLWVEIRDSNGIIIGQYFFERTRDKDDFIKVIIPVFEKKDHYHIFVYKYTDGISQIINHGWFNIRKVSNKGEGILSYWYVLVFVIILLLLILLLIYIIKKIIKKIRRQ